MDTELKKVQQQTNPLAFLKLESYFSSLAKNERFTRV